MFFVCCKAVVKVQQQKRTPTALNSISGNGDKIKTRRLARATSALHNVAQHTHTDTHTHTQPQGEHFGSCLHVTHGKQKHDEAALLCLIKNITAPDLPVGGGGFWPWGGRESWADRADSPEAGARTISSGSNKCRATTYA